MITKNCKSLEEVGSKCVVHELFYSVVREVRDEVSSGDLLYISLQCMSISHSIKILQVSEHD